VNQKFQQMVVLLNKEIRCVRVERFNARNMTMVAISGSPCKYINLV